MFGLSDMKECMKVGAGVSVVLALVCSLNMRASHGMQAWKDGKLSSFDAAIPLVLRHEGHLANIKGDKGGQTSYGISYTFLKKAVEEDPDMLERIDYNHNQILDEEDVIFLSLPEAEEIYREEFWDKYEISTIADQELASKFFDFTVNMGYHESAKLLINAYEAYCPSSKVKSFSQMIKEINGFDNKSSRQLIVGLCNQAELFYRGIVKINPVYNKFLKGWLNRTWDGVTI